MSTSDQIHTSAETIGSQIAEYVTAFLQNPQAYRGQQLRGGGPVAEFERLLAARCGFPYCLATSNATTALLVLALAVDLKGKEIIAAPNSWGGTYGPFEFAGAKLVMAQADDTGNICPGSVERLITGSTAAVLAVDWRGTRHQATRIRDVCTRHQLLYIADTSLMPDPLGSDSSPADVQVMSFGPGKLLPLGEGGAILTSSRAIYERALTLSQHSERIRSEGLNPSEQHPMLNARIHPLAALIGAKLLAHLTPLL